MRRPLKPFVTEYKGSRRAPPPFNEPANFETERPTPKLAEARMKPDPEESSYEAALRAADALFAAPKERPQNERSQSEPTSSERDSAADIRDTLQNHSVQADRVGPDPAAPERNGGRILRVIDEPPPPEYAALEAEFAPKRRGRKPGSKNKPKIPAQTAELVRQADAPQPALGLPVAPSVPQAAAIAHASKPHVAVPAQRKVVALSAAPSEPRSDRRYAWVRDRLKPGEDWKRRRLPRVCW